MTSRQANAAKRTSGLKNVKSIIAIASCKGGVGKSTVSATTACGMAKQHALKGFVHQHGEQVVSANQEMTCADGEETKYYKLKHVGSVMPISKLKGDPEHARPFMYRGASCWGVKDVEWENDKLHSFNGIACQVEGEQHVLVDKF